MEKIVKFAKHLSMQAMHCTTDLVFHSYVQYFSLYLRSVAVSIVAYTWRGDSWTKPLTIVCNHQTTEQSQSQRSLQLHDVQTFIGKTLWGDCFEKNCVGKATRCALLCTATPASCNQAPREGVQPGRRPRTHKCLGGQWTSTLKNEMGNYAQSFYCYSLIYTILWCILIDCAH